MSAPSLSGLFASLRGSLPVRLWRGEMPLADAFWLHAIIGVGMTNLVCSFARFLVIAEDGPSSLAWLFLLLPVPYGIVSVVGVWRRTTMHPGVIGELARWTALAWGIAAIVL